MDAPARNPLRTGIALTACLALIACGSLAGGSTMSPFRDANLSMQSAQEIVAVGKTTQDEALSALGPATDIQFDNGYTIWVYRARSAQLDADKAEFVILFAPSGVVKKTRLRPVFAARSADPP